MNSPSDNRADGAVVGRDSAGAQAMAAFLAPRVAVTPFEFRSLTAEDSQDTMGFPESGEPNSNIRNQPVGGVYEGMFQGNTQDRALRDAGVRSAIEAARKQGFEAGEREGRRACRSESEAEMNLSLTAERQQVLETVRQFRAARDRYFAEVEQEIVKLALAIAERVLHREAQIDPLLLTGVVRVALEKMADRSGVVLRVAGADVEAWERVFHSTEASERPRVAEDERLQRGECVLETRMGTVELGVHVQLGEIEKGFFDLLNHRPVE